MVNVIKMRMSDNCMHYAVLRDKTASVVGEWFRRQHMHRDIPGPSSQRQGSYWRHVVSSKMYDIIIYCIVRGDSSRPIVGSTV